MVLIIRKRQGDIYEGLLEKMQKIPRAARVILHQGIDQNNGWSALAPEPNKTIADPAQWYRRFLLAT